MKVALDVSAVPPQIAGAGRYIDELARRLPDADVTTTLVTRRGDTRRWRDRSPRADVRGLVPDGRVARLAYEAWFLGASATARGVDLWHAPHYTMPRRGTRPTVVTIHDLTFFTNPEWHERPKVTFFRRAITYSAQHARVLVSVSDYSARLLTSLIPSHAPIVVAPLGVELATFQPWDRDDESVLRGHGLRTEVPYVFFVGTVEPRKGLDVLLDAFGQVARDDHEVELWLAGQSGWGEGPIEAQIEGHPFRARIRRLGFVDDALLPVLYRHARAVTYPSRGEGFGLPVLEAMACGASVVTTRDTVMAEVAGDGARLVPVGDVDALAASLVDVLESSDDDRRQWAGRARERAEHFTWERCVAQHLVAYEKAMAS
ncbi:MAG TPA: glycosyltransferase family 1 protein [Acidimicrobiales bacterium]|nr:glycosyltransferase family 1 protein [Acidimicrobiales bacterium]